MIELRYKAELVRAMNYIGELENSLFVGQAVRVPGTAMSGTLENVFKSKLIEFPVEEDLQMGYTIGLAMNGFLPVSIFPRWNFLILATNQIVNHLDKLGEMMDVKIPPKVIIRTGIGAQNPMHPGPQHTGDYSEAFKIMAPNLEIVRLDDPDDIFPAYKKAADRTDGVSSLIIEWGDFYGTK
jgi:pyruvate/2-oxoglutarate/acetoin dehydrogenase E1 component